MTRTGLTKVMKSIRSISITFTSMMFILLLGICACGGNEKKTFYRVSPESFQNDIEHFNVDKKLGRISFRKGKDQFQLDDIPTPDGCFFYLKGKQQVKITPPVSGDIRFYTYLYFQSLDKSDPIHFTLGISRAGSGLTGEIGHEAGLSESKPIFKNLKIAPGDRLLLKFEGRGIVYFSTPLIYKNVPAVKRKNVIFIALDTLRGDQIGARADGLSITPNIDRFIKDSVYFKNACAQTSWTLPSFMSLFTGLYEYNHDVGVKNSLGLDKPSLMIPVSNRFITFGLHGGKVMGSRWGFGRGFDHYKHFRFAGSLFPQGGRSLFRKAVELLEESHFPDLFLFLHTYQVHSPYTPPEEFLLKLNKTPKYKKLEAVNYNEPAKTYLPVDDELGRSLKELYRAEILAFDSYFGTFIDQLKAMNLYDNTMIVFMSDHGEEFFEHRGWAHSHGLYQEQIRVPIIVKFPGNRFSGREITDVVGVIDIMPTIMSYYGIDSGSVEIDGRDLMPVIEKKRKRSPEYVISTISTGRYFEAVPPKIAVLFDRYKLIYNEPFSPVDLAFFEKYARPPEPPRFELYDLSADPGETGNIFGRHPEAIKKIMPVIVDIGRLIKRKIAEMNNSGMPMDKEVEEQLKSLGYL